MKKIIFIAIISGLIASLIAGLHFFVSTAEVNAQANALVDPSAIIQEDVLEEKFVIEDEEVWTWTQEEGSTTRDANVMKLCVEGTVERPKCIRMYHNGVDMRFENLAGHSFYGSENGHLFQIKNGNRWETALSISRGYGRTTIGPRNGWYLQTGDGNSQLTDHGLNNNEDLMVTGKLEVDGELYVDGGLKFQTEDGCKTLDLSKKVAQVIDC